MVKKPAAPASQSAEALAKHYLELVALSDLLPINVGLSPAHELTMISLLGAPQMPLTRVDQPDKASPLVKALKSPRNVSSQIAVTGIRPAVASLVDVLGQAMAQERKAGHRLDAVLGTEGMLNVRFRKPDKRRDLDGDKQSRLGNGH